MRRAVGAATGASLGALAVLGVACNALVGINDGQLAEDASPDVTTGDGPVSDAPASDGPRPDSEGGPITDGTAEAEGGAVRDGPPYTPPIVTTVNADAGGPGLFRTSPGVVAGPSNIVVVFDDDDNPNTGVHYSSTAVSTNGGASFTENGPFPDSPDGGPSDLGYPTIARDAVNGNVYVSANGSAAGNYNVAALIASANGGVSFSPAINAADTLLPSSAFVDGTSVAVDNAPGQGQGVVYVAHGIYDTSSVYIGFSAYHNGTFTYTAAANLGAGNQASLPWVAVAPNHFVYVVFYGVTGTTPLLGVARSNNQGQSFYPYVTIAPLHMPFVAGTYNGNLGLLGEGPDGGATPVDLYSSPQIAANPVTGALYIAYADATQGSDKANIYFSQSSDGQMWSPPVQVNDDTTTHDQFLPAIAVSQDGARVAIDFDDRRSDPNNVAVERWAAVGAISGSTVTFEPNFRVSSAFPLLTRSNGTRGYFAIHSGMSADATFFYDAFTAASPQGNLDVKLARYGVLY
jgi:hypothetical protein